MTVRGDSRDRDTCVGHEWEQNVADIEVDVEGTQASRLHLGIDVESDMVTSPFGAAGGTDQPISLDPM